MLPEDEGALVLVAYAEVLREPLRSTRLEGRAARLSALLVGLLYPSVNDAQDLAARVARMRALDPASRELLKMTLFDLALALYPYAVDRDRDRDDERDRREARPEASARDRDGGAR
jgi:hypothetical protein